MFGLFGKKENKSPQERAADCQAKKDWVGLARAYYDLGVAAMDGGKQNEAVLWLHRADTVYSAKDEVFEKADKNRLFHPGIVDDCSERIGTLEDAPLLYNTILSEIEEKAEELDGGPKIRIWGLLSMARLVKLGERLAMLPGCEVLGQLDWAVDMICQSLRERPSQEDYDQLMDLCDGLYDLSDSEDFFGGGGEIPAPGGPFQVFDLNGMGTLLELNGYVDSHLRLVAALTQGKEPPSAETGVIACALLPDYYVRTLGGNPENAPQVQAELQRIWSDYEFVSTAMTWEQVEEKVAAYKQLDILA